MSDMTANGYANLMKNELDRMECEYPSLRSNGVGARLDFDIKQLGTPTPPLNSSINLILFIPIYS